MFAPEFLSVCKSWAAFLNFACRDIVVRSMVRSTLLSKILSATRRVNFRRGEPIWFWKWVISIFNTLNGSFCKKRNLRTILWTSNKRFYKVTMISDDFWGWHISLEVGHFCENAKQQKKWYFLSLDLFSGGFSGFNGMIKKWNGKKVNKKRIINN